METLIVFTKAPEEGKVKTRLAATSALLPHDVLLLAEAFLADILKTAAMSRAKKIILAFTPASKEREMRDRALKYISEDRLQFVPQVGDSFHACIENAFDSARRQGATSCVMIGSDAPMIQPYHLDDAFEKLDTRGGAVLGPSVEGGFYLVGLVKEILPDFEMIFSEGAELLNFAHWLKSNGFPLSLLEEVTDVDVASDLVTLVANIGAMEYAGERILPTETAKAIRTLNLTVIRNSGTRHKAAVKNG